LTSPILRAFRPLLALPFAAAALWLGCAPDAPPNPFVGDAGPDAGAGGSGGDTGGGPADAAPDADPTIGGPCVDDGQCNDAIACTSDHCDTTIGHCRFVPDAEPCQNAFYCDGVERCDNKLGCVAGVPIGCTDNDSCTIDSCEEKTHLCKHGKRDADGDGDPDDHCGGGDCDDTDPTVSSKLAEVCENQKDDNCNGVVDEMPCVSPKHDTCADPLNISGAGSYALNTTGAHFDYPTSCGLGNMPGAADVVAALLLPAGPPVDVRITARTQFAQVSLAIAGQCGDPATEIACGMPFADAQGGQVAKILGRSLGNPGQMTALPIYVATAQPTDITLQVEILPASAAPTNETCGTAEPITVGVPVSVPILDAAEDLASACGTPLGELVYSFSLAATSDVDVYGSSVDGDGLPSISLRDATCALPADEITCQTAMDAHVYRHSVAPGTYYVAVSASAPTSALLTVEASPPTPLLPNDACPNAPMLPPNKTIDVPLAGHQDDVNLGCFPGAVDAAYELDLAVKSDVLLVERVSAGDVAAVELSEPACSGPMDQLACNSGGQSPVRAAKHGVPPGLYRVVVESLNAQDTHVTAFTRPALPPTLVPFADGCADAVTIPPEGGFFEGNTANASADFNTGCDNGGLPQGGAPDQLLMLTIPATKRVIFDMAGSSYNTIVDVRKGPACPGAEVPMACAVGYSADRSFLDLTLSAGTYYVQIDGFSLDSGNWFLDVRVVDP
jgi:Putative metal-binding motif